MSERPPPLSRTALRVVNASRLLTDIQKRVMLETAHLDGGTEGCYARPQRFARRLGRSVDTVKRTRKQLCQLGLMVHHARKGERTDSWYATLYPECVPKSVNGIRDTEIFTLAERLDWILAGKGCTRNIGGDRRAERAAVPPTPAPTQGAAVPPDAAPTQGAAVPPNRIANREAAGERRAATQVADVLDPGGAAAPALSLERLEQSDFSTHDEDGGDHGRDPRTDAERALLKRWRDARERRGAA